MHTCKQIVIKSKIKSRDLYIFKSATVPGSHPRVWWRRPLPQPAVQREDHYGGRSQCSSQCEPPSCWTRPGELALRPSWTAPSVGRTGLGPTCRIDSRPWNWGESSSVHTHPAWTPGSPLHCLPGGGKHRGPHQHNLAPLFFLIRLPTDASTFFSEGMLLKDTVFFLPPPTFCTEGSWKKTTAAV